MPITNNTNVTLNRNISKNFEFSLDLQDTIFVLTRNNSDYKEGINNLISKMVCIKELNYINLDRYNTILTAFGIEKLNIFSISNNVESNTINSITSSKGSKVVYIEMNCNQFIKFINSEGNFLNYNKNSLYILRDGNFLDIKNLFAVVNGYKINIGRGGSQKSHILSPLDLRLSSYMLAMFNCNYKVLSYLNAFNDLNKNRYLSYTNMYFKPIEFKALNIKKIPLYSEDLVKPFLDCSDIKCQKGLIRYV